MTEQNSYETIQAETLVRFENAKKNRKEAKENLKAPRFERITNSDIKKNTPRI